MFVFIGVVAILAHYCAEYYRPNIDFGGAVNISRTVGRGNSITVEILPLSEDMILETITTPAVLDSLTKDYGWNVSQQEMLKSIEVKVNLSTYNNYVLVVNTHNPERSRAIALYLGQLFYDEYKQQWEIACQEYLNDTKEELKLLEKELEGYKATQKKLKKEHELLPIDSELNLKDINSKLSRAQDQFLEAYREYFSRIDKMRSVLQLDIDLAQRVMSPDNIELIEMQQKLEELDKQSVELDENMLTQNPDIYRMAEEYPKITGLPNSVVYLYENIQILQKQKLSLILEGIIKDKEQLMKKQKQEVSTIKKLLESDSCDLQLRDIGK